MLIKNLNYVIKFLSNLDQRNYLPNIVNKQIVLCNFKFKKK